MECSDVIQIFLSVIACYLSWMIPRKIMWEQTYASLSTDYRSCEFGVAIQGIIDFFIDDCKSDPKKVKKEYQRRFICDEYSVERNLPADEVINQYKEKNADLKKKENITPELCLHFQRRMLAQFFYQLALCARTPYIGKNRICRDFTKGEAHIVRILILMDKAIEEDRAEGDRILWQDIGCVYRVRNYENEKGINQYLSEIYSVLKNSKIYMEG